MNPTILRTYQYVVALIAIHMVVLGAANALRVVAELALGAPSGGFTGLPFLFAEGGSRPLEIHREQMSLAIALLVVGAPAWYLHWRLADRAARRSETDRSSDWRSIYLHTVMAVTALLTLAYVARTLDLLLSAALFGSASPGFFDPQWPARAAGASAMALVAAGTWLWHSLRSEGDRRAGVGGSGGEIRRFHTYAVVFIVTIVATVTAVFLIMGIWNATVGFVEPSTRPGFSPGPDAPPIPDRANILKSALSGSAPPLVLAVLVGALYARRAGRVARQPGSDGAAERESAARAVFLYLALFIAGTGGLAALAAVGQTTLSHLDSSSRALPLGPALGGTVPPAIVLLTVWSLAWLMSGRDVRRSAGARGPADARSVYLYLSLGAAQAVALLAAGFTVQRLLRPVFGAFPAAIRDFATPAPFLVLFAVAWFYHRAVLRRESRAPQTRTQVEARRTYSYLFYVGGVAAAAIGIAGSLGVLGSYALADRTHGPDEIALYVTLAAIGLAVSLYQRSPFRGILEPTEREAPQRRIALSLAVLGGAGAALVFGSGAVFRLVNAILAVQFATGAAHDLWHLLADTAVGLVVGLVHWRILRADRAHAAPTVAPGPLILVLPTPVERMRQRLVARFGGEGGRVFETDRESLPDLVRCLDAASAGTTAARAADPEPALSRHSVDRSEGSAAGPSGPPSPVAPPQDG